MVLSKKQDGVYKKNDDICLTKTVALLSKQNGECLKKKTEPVMKLNKMVPL